MNAQKLSGRDPLVKKYHGGGIIQGKPMMTWASPAVFFARRRLQDSAQGFNPGISKIDEFALKLKGREADWINLAPIAAQELECSIETC